MESGNYVNRTESDPFRSSLLGISDVPDITLDGGWTTPQDDPRDAFLEDLFDGWPEGQTFDDIFLEGSGATNDIQHISQSEQQVAPQTLLATRTQSSQTRPPASFSPTQNMSGFDHDQKNASFDAERDRLLLEAEGGSWVPEGQQIGLTCQQGQASSQYPCFGTPVGAYPTSQSSFTSTWSSKPGYTHTPTKFRPIQPHPMSQLHQRTPGRVLPSTSSAHPHSYQGVQTGLPGPCRPLPPRPLTAFTSSPHSAPTQTTLQPSTTTATNSAAPAYSRTFPRPTETINRQQEFHLTSPCLAKINLQPQPPRSSHRGEGTETDSRTVDLDPTPEIVATFNPALIDKPTDYRYACDPAFRKWWDHKFLTLYGQSLATDAARKRKRNRDPEAAMRKQRGEKTPNETKTKPMERSRLARTEEEEGKHGGESGLDDRVEEPGRQSEKKGAEHAKIKKKPTRRSGRLASMQEEDRSRSRASR